MFDNAASPSLAAVQPSRPLTPISENEPEVAACIDPSSPLPRTTALTDAIVDSATPTIVAMASHMDDSDSSPSSPPDTYTVVKKPASPTPSEVPDMDQGTAADADADADGKADTRADDDSTSSADSKADKGDGVASSAGDVSDTNSTVGQTTTSPANDEAVQDVASSTGDQVDQDGVSAATEETDQDVPSSTNDQGDQDVPSSSNEQGDQDVPSSTNEQVCDAAVITTNAATVTDNTNEDTVDKITEKISFHVDADLMIKVISKELKEDTHFKVSSANFACASTVWRFDLYGNSKLRESQDDPLPVDIGDSPPLALEVLMNITHYRFDQVPTDDMDLVKLYHITQLTDKFLCTHLIRPWAATWLKNNSVQEALEPTDDGKMSKIGATIAWELGENRLLQAMAEFMIMTVTVDKDGDLLHGTGDKLKDLILPPGMFDAITEIRLNTVTGLLAAIQDPYDKLAAGSRFCTLNEHQECDATMIGSLTMQLATCGLFPVPTVGTYKGSLNQLETVISGLKIQRWEGKDIVPHLSHVGCNLGFAQNAKTAMEGMRFPLEPTYILHLERQRHLSGIRVEE